MNISIKLLLILLHALFVSTVQAQESTGRPNSVNTPAVGYSTVAQALAALKAKPGVQILITKPDAWTIINEPENIVWSFTPETHAAYPAVVRRALKVNDKGWAYIEMSALCQAEKEPCDKLIEEFKASDKKMRRPVDDQFKK